MNNYSPSHVVKHWHHDNTLYCAFNNYTIVEYSDHKIPERIVEVDRMFFPEIINDLKTGRLEFDDLEDIEEY